MSYKVMMQYGSGTEMPCADLHGIKDLVQLEAKIKEKLLADAASGVKVTYRIYEWDDVVKVFLPGDAASSNPTESGGSAGKGSGATFRPTPLNPSPRPAGIPHNWVKDADEDDKKK